MPSSSRAGLSFSRAISIVFTKADKLGPVKAKVNAKQWMDALLDTWESLPPYFITSSEKKTGKDEVLDYIDEILKEISYWKMCIGNDQAAAQIAQGLGNPRKLFVRFR